MPIKELPKTNHDLQHEQSMMYLVRKISSRSHQADGHGIKIYKKFKVVNGEQWDRQRGRQVCMIKAKG